MASKIFYDCGCMEQGDQFFDCGKHARVPPGEPPAQPATDLAWWVRSVLATFKASEADGYRSKDRQFAIEMLEKGLEARLQPPAAVVQPAEMYEQYHRRVVDAIRKRLLARWPPIDADDRRDMEQNVSFFDRECDYHDEFAEGLDPEEIADDEIDAAR